MTDVGDAPPEALVEVLRKFYGAGPQASWEELLPSFDRAPYAGTTALLADRFGVTDYTDLNYGRCIQLALTQPSLTVMLSLVGPYAAVMLEGWVIAEPHDVPTQVRHVLAEGGFAVLGAVAVNRRVGLWDGGPTTVWHALFDDADDDAGLGGD